jgi:glycosyltransferase involved in cell wall biosynthesis
MNKVKFSIIIPSYKINFFKECIDSVLSQTYKDFEVIILNDASPQNLESIIDNYDDDRILYFKNDIGFGAYNVIGNWNKGLSLTSGDYVLCMGDDDKLLPNCLSDYATAINLYPDCDLFHTMTEIIDEESRIIDIQEARPQWESVYSIIWHLWNGRRQFIGDWLFRTKSIKDKGGFIFQPYAWGSDHLSVMRIASDKGVINMQNPGFQYRESRFNITTNSGNTRFKIIAMNNIKRWYFDFLKIVPDNDLDRIYYNFILQNLDKHIEKRISYDLSIRIMDKPLSLFYWIFSKRKYEINFKIIFMSCLIALKIKICRFL